MQPPAIGPCAVIEGQRARTFIPRPRRHSLVRRGAVRHHDVGEVGFEFQSNRNRRRCHAEVAHDQLLDHAATDAAANFDGDRVLRQPRSVRVPAGTAHRQVCGPVIARDGGAGITARNLVIDE